MSDTIDESSLLFSIRELSKLEAERLEAERARGEECRRVAESKRFEERERARRRETERLRADEERRREAERAAADEALRNLEHAAVEHHRAEVEARSQNELALAQRHHELELARHRATLFRARCRWVAAVSVLTTGLVGAFAAVLSSELHAAERLAGEHAAAFARERDAHVRATTKLVGTNRRVQALQAELTTRRARAAPLDAPDPPPVKTGHSAGEHRRREGSIKGTSPKCTRDGDPLNGCLD